MARKFQYQGARRMASYGYMRARRGYARRGGARGIAGIGLPYIAGGVLGYAAPTVHPMQDTVVTLMAILPVRLPYNVQNIAKGYVLGRMARAYLPGFGGFGTQTSSGSNFV
jgi:hypothetical protein